MPTQHEAGSSAAGGAAFYRCFLSFGAVTALGLLFGLFGR
jgi:hypothetical protein